MKTTDFYTRPRSEEGIRVPLLDANGNDSGEWIIVIGLDCDAYDAYISELVRVRQANDEIDDPVDRKKHNSEEGLRVNAMLIKGWSFDEAFTQQAVIEFLRNAPVVAAQAQSVATDRNRFFGPGSASSSNGHASSDVSEAEAGKPQSDASASH